MEDNITAVEQVYSPGMTGTFFQTIDAKGRISIPVRLIRELADSFYITEGIGGRFLSIIPREAWLRRAARLAAVPASDEKAQRAIRRMFSSAQGCDVDSNGRVQLYDNMRAYARLQKDIVIIGSNDRAEIWAKEIWDEQFADDLSGEVDISSLAGYGL